MAQSKLLWLFICGAIFASVPAFSISAAVTVYKGVTVIDGAGARPRPDMAIIVADGRIKDIVSSTAWRAALGVDAAKAHVVSLKGDYALPGLIDSHVHLATDPDPVYERAELRRYIYSGVTAVRDMAGDTRVLANLSRSAGLNEIEAPDIYFAALMAGPDFFHDARTAASAKGQTPGNVPWMKAVTSQTDVKLSIAEAHGTGATALKIYADLSGPDVSALAAEAHRQHMLVWAHAAVFPASPLEVARAGVDVMSHACLLAYQASHPVPPAYHNRPGVDAATFQDGTSVLDPLFAEMKARRIILDATIYVYDVMWKVPNALPPPYCHEELAQRITAAAHKAGVEISAGTDADSAWDKPFPSLFDEIELLVRTAGFTPLEAIRAAALIGARTVGEDKEIGSLEPGKRADMVFLEKNPLDNIANIRAVLLTVKGERQFWRANYAPITRDEAKNELDDP